MKALTIRNVDARLARALERETARRGTSLNETVLDLLRRGLGVDKSRLLVHGRAERGTRWRSGVEWGCPRRLPDAGRDAVTESFQLGRYRLFAELGHGGMADVYLAHMRGLGDFVKEVALKRVLPELLAEPELTQMFLDEARISARLEHPNIVQVFDIGQEREHLFFTMEYVRGTDARALLRRTGDGATARLQLAPALAMFRRRYKPQLKVWM